jgi:hypothetical protein
MDSTLQCVSFFLFWTILWLYSTTGLLHITAIAGDNTAPFTGSVRKYVAILNISWTGRVALMQPVIQSEETSLCTREQSLSRGG